MSPNGRGPEAANGWLAAPSAGSVADAGMRVPELGLVIAEHAAGTSAAGSEVPDTDLTVATILNRLGRGADAAVRVGAALPGAEGDVAAALRVELARCALDAGFAVAALAVLRPVIAYRLLSPVPRAAALMTAAEALAACGRPAGVRDALEAVDELCADDDDPALRLPRVEAHVVSARQHRRDGASESAEAEARAGLEMLDGPDPDGGEVHGRLVLEVVLALLDRAAPATATRVAESVLMQPVRSTTAAAAAWIALALATRVKLPAGQHRPALQLLTDAVRGAGRHGLDAPLVGCEDALAQLHEERGEFAEALQHLRNARAAEYRRRVAVDAVREVLDAHLPPGRERAEAPEAVAGMIREQLTDAHRKPGALPMRRPDDVDALARRAPRTPAPPAAPPASAPPVQPAPRPLTPAVGPETPAEPPAPEIPIAETPAPETAVEPPDTAGRHERPAPAQIPQDAPSIPSTEQDEEQDAAQDEEQAGGHARHGDGSDTRIPVSALLATAHGATRPGGRRRAEDRAEHRPEETGDDRADRDEARSAEPDRDDARSADPDRERTEQGGGRLPGGQDLLVSGGADTELAPAGGGGPDAGLGDLLYEALAAFHRGQSSTEGGSGGRREQSDEGPPDGSDASGPDPWPPPASARRSAAGD